MVLIKGTQGKGKLETPREFQPRLKYRGVELPSVTQIIKAARLTPDFSGIDHNVLVAKGKIGTAVHEYAAANLGGHPRLMATAKAGAGERGEGYIKSWEQLMTSDLFTRIDPIAIEDQLYMPGLCGGMLDLLALVSFRSDPATYVVFDWKTRKKSFGDSIQLAGYKVMGEAKHEIKGAERWLVSLNEDGSFPSIHKFTQHKRDIKIFMSALDLWHFRYQYGLY